MARLGDLPIAGLVAVRGRPGVVSLATSPLLTLVQARDGLDNGRVGPPPMTALRPAVNSRSVKLGCPGQGQEALLDGQDRIEFVESVMGRPGRAVPISARADRPPYPDFEVMRRLLAGRVIFDGRNLYDPKAMEAYGFTHYGIGRAGDAAG